MYRGDRFRILETRAGVLFTRVTRVRHAYPRVIPALVGPITPLPGYRGTTLSLRAPFPSAAVLPFIPSASGIDHNKHTLDNAINIHDLHMHTSDIIYVPSVISDSYLRILTRLLRHYLRTHNISADRLFISPKRFPPENNPVYRMPTVLRTSRPSSLGRPKRESLKNPRLRVKRKTGWEGERPAQDISPGAAITSITSIPGSGRGKSFMKSSSRKERDTSIPTRHTSAATVLF